LPELAARLEKLGRLTTVYFAKCVCMEERKVGR
jgi:hypothetical protein